MLACHECDLLIKRPVLAINQKAFCPRCHYLLTARYKNSINRIIAFSLSGLLFLVLSLSFPFITFSTHGIAMVVNLKQAINMLAVEDYLSLTLLIYISIIFIPAFYLLSASYVAFAIKKQVRLPAVKKLLRLNQQVLPWNMVEIFLIGVLVSFIKIVALAEVGLGLSFWAYVLFSLCLIVVITHIDTHQFWIKIKALYDE